ncbi:YoaK family protein [Catenulispora yoronensis]|uniref:YoaK family protein n=1 Tax=Catenulispora yoronensis TaxID=450799 RepID=A0ABN2UXA6_9ACTN
MKAALLRLSDRLYDGGSAEYGALPAALIAATLVTGTVDAVSYLALGHIFVANMTGNVVFLGFAVAGAKGLTVWAPCLAVACFGAGAWTETRLGRRSAGDDPRRLSHAVAAHAAFVTLALLIAALEDDTKTATRVQLTAILAFGFGVQNAVVRKLAVPDLTTTVLTMTVTGLAADPLGKATVRRLVSLGCMFLGALVGGLLVLHQNVSTALGLALVLLAGAGMLARIGGAGR